MLCYRHTCDTQCASSMCQCYEPPTSFSSFPPRGNLHLGPSSLQDVSFSAICVLSLSLHLAPRQYDALNSPTLGVVPIAYSIDRWHMHIIIYVNMKK